VIAASSTKPYGFLPHYPGPGVGGHCIPVDPVYLLDHARSRDINLKLIEDSILINKERAEKIFSKALELLNGKGESKKAKILIIGVAYKPGVADIRESPALKIIELAQSAGLEVSYHDPYVPQVNGLSSVELSQEILSGYDVIIITTDHDNIAYDQILSAQKPIIDTRNVFVYTSQPQVVKI
jgi:UDP-N-acetyl-D-glucosamine dehydrogenase